LHVEGLAQQRRLVIAQHRVQLDLEEEVALEGDGLGVAGDAGGGVGVAVDGDVVGGAGGEAAGGDGDEGGGDGVVVGRCDGDGDVVVDAGGAGVDAVDG